MPRTKKEKKSFTDLVGSRKKRHPVKLSDEQFYSILRENAGIYAKTAKAIQKQFNISYTRQAVKDRADRRPDILQDIREENIDIAEEGLHSLLISWDEKVRFQAVKFCLSTLGKLRGYVERTELSTPDGQSPIALNIIVKNEEQAKKIQAYKEKKQKKKTNM